jgi:hypothetical protein
LRVRCTTSKTGRSVSIHPDEQLLRQLHQSQVTAAVEPNSVNGWQWSILSPTSVNGSSRPYPLPQLTQKSIRLVVHDIGTASCRRCRQNNVVTRLT